MSSEEFDKKIRDAADQHYPAYNEKAWSKMNKLLDEHLPEEKKKDRKGLIFFLLLFLLLGGVSWYFLTRPGQDLPITQTQAKTESNTKDGKENNSDIIAKPAEERIQPSNENETIRGSNKISSENNPSPGSIIPETIPDPGTREATGQKQEPGSSRPNQIAVAEQGASREQGRKSIAEKNAPQNLNTPANKPGVTNPISKEVPKDPKEIQEARDNNVVKPYNDPAIISNDVQSRVATNPDQKIISTDTVSDRPEPQASTEILAKKPGKEKSKTKKDRGLYFSLSAGPDISLVGLSNTGKLRPVMGAGIAYKFADRFTLRTGFYSVDKVYTASPKQYKPSYTPSPNFIYLSKVDADCKVYEIPLALAYSFGKPGKQNWFASLGMSTYIMKTEKYDYLYKMPNGSSYTYQRTINDENKHFFSVMSISGGYTRKLNERFSLSAEPYFKLPVSGVGIGNIKLNSAGVLFSVNARLTGGKK